MQNLTILALAIPEISLGDSKFKEGHMTLTTQRWRVNCHSYARPDVVYMCTKADDCSLDRVRDMGGANQNLNCSYLDYVQMMLKLMF